MILGTRGGADLILVNSPLKNYDIAERMHDFTLPTLGLGYIATQAAHDGFRVGVLDMEAHAMGVTQAAALLNAAKPRWIGLNLLAPTFRHSVALLRRLNPNIQIMLGGHQAKAMPDAILADARIPRIDALIIGEAELRVPLLLSDTSARARLPGVYWRDEHGRGVRPGKDVGASSLLSPDLDAMPFLDRRYLAQDPYNDNEVLESAMVASRGCPFDCSFCGAAISANPDISIRMRRPDIILAEIHQLRTAHGVQRVRFVDDLFLANRKIMRTTMEAFAADGAVVRWDATGRINVLDSASDDLLDLMVRSGCREVALGIESGSDRLLAHIDKKISVAQIRRVVGRLCTAGIDVKGYFILGLPTETRREHEATIALIDELHALTANLAGRFRCSAFEYRPYPGTPDWNRLLAAGYEARDMLDYDASPESAGPRERDEFNFSTGLQFGEVPVAEVRANLADLMTRQQAA